MLTDATSTGATTRIEAGVIARILVLGRRQPTQVLAETRHGDWWQFRARWPDATNSALDSLYVHAPTGSLAWAWTPLTDDDLAARLGPDRLARYAA